MTGASVMTGAGAGEGLMVSLTGPQGTVAAVPDFVEDTSSELERKSKALSVMALFESVTYCVLFYFWIISPSVAGKALAGFVHGLVWLAFVAMTVIIRPDIGWTWGYTALVILTGPIGGVLVFIRIRRTPREVLVPPRAPAEGR
jgi:hypothetical protein